MSDLVFYASLAFIGGFLFNGLRDTRKMYLISHKCKPHSCNFHAFSCACFERDNGEMWVKEYSNTKQKEGRTYQVNFCPWCGAQAKVRIDAGF